MPSASICPEFSLPILQGVKTPDSEAFKKAEEYEILRVETKESIMQELFSRHKTRKRMSTSNGAKIYVFAKKNVNSIHDNTCPYCLNKDLTCMNHEDLYTKTSMLKLVDEEVVSLIGLPPN
jgi:hypothetical protein